MDTGLGITIAGVLIPLAAVTIAVIKTKNGNGIKKYVIKETCQATHKGIDERLELMQGINERMDKKLDDLLAK